MCSRRYALRPALAFVPRLSLIGGSGGGAIRASAARRNLSGPFASRKNQAGYVWRQRIERGEHLRSRLSGLRPWSTRGAEHYDLGSGYGHIAIEVDDVDQATARIKAQGGKILRDAGPMNAGSTLIAFVEDPDGYPIERIGAGQGNRG